MKRLPLLLLLIGVCFISAAPKLVKTKINDEITVSIPVGFFPMTPEDITQRFPSVRAPLGAFTNEDRVIDISVNISATQWPDGDKTIAAKFFKAALFNLYDRVEIVKEGMQEVHKKEYIFFEFESRASSRQRTEGASEPSLKYTYIQYLVEPGRTLVFTFSCPKSLRSEWEHTANEIMKSVRVK
jgi:hypothetical protein